MLHNNSKALSPPEAFIELGKMIAYNNINFPAVYHNPKKARRRWRMIVGVMEKTGAIVRTVG